MGNKNSVVDIRLPGYTPQADNFIEDDSSPVAVIYKIPPAVWVVVFLVIGYVGIRAVMED